MSARFYCPVFPNQGPFRLDPEESRHLSQVSRVKVGELVELFDGDGKSVKARVVEVGRNLVELTPVDEFQLESPPAVSVTLAVGVPKGDRFDWLVEKATEVGVTKIVPIQSRRSVVEPRSTKIDRLRRVVVEASKQCGRSRLMTIEGLTPWSDFSRRESSALRLIAHPGGMECRDWPERREGDEVVVAIGPEGGFTDEEVDEASALGWRKIGLGRNILRIETAAIVVAASIHASLSPST